MAEEQKVVVKSSGQLEASAMYKIVEVGGNLICNNVAIGSLVPLSVGSFILSGQLEKLKKEGVAVEYELE